jgi:hypothetical protein
MSTSSLLSIEEAASQLGIMPSSMLGYVRSGHIKGEHLGRGRWAVSQRSIDKYIAGMVYKKRPVVVQPDDPTIRLIPLTKGRVAVVDAEDYARISAHLWWAHRAGKHRDTWYACRTILFPGGGKKNISLHHAVLGFTPHGCREIGHINRDGLDCRKANLRVTSRRRDCFNRQPQMHCESKFKGVFRDAAIRRRGLWRARIYYRKRHICLGTFETEEAAAHAYDAAARKYFGKFAYLNFPDEVPA